MRGWEVSPFILPSIENARMNKNSFSGKYKQAGPELT